MHVQYLLSLIAVKSFSLVATASLKGPKGIVILLPFTGNAVVILLNIPLVFVDRRGLSRWVK